MWRRNRVIYVFTGRWPSIVCVWGRNGSISELSGHISGVDVLPIVLNFAFLLVLELSLTVDICFFSFGVTWLIATPGA